MLDLLRESHTIVLEIGSTILLAIAIWNIIKKEWRG
jgi:hypothetical protein